MALERRAITYVPYVILGVRYVARFSIRMNFDSHHPLSRVRTVV